MEYELGTISTVSLSLFVFILWKIRSSKSSYLCRPPGPPNKLPVIGHLHLLASTNLLPHVYFAQLAKKYGPVMSLQMGSRPFVIASTKEAAEEFLKTSDPLFASRPQYTPLGRIFSYDHHDMGMAPYGERWRQLRRIVTSDLLNPRKVEAIRPKRMQEMKRMLQEISSLCGQVVDMSTKLSELTINFVCIMAIGTRYFGQGSVDRKEGEKFIEIVEELHVLAGKFSIGELIPWLRWADLDKVESRFKAIAKRADEFIENMIREHRSKSKEVDEEEKDSIDHLLQLYDRGEECLQGTTLKGLMNNLFSGASDTSSTALEWGLAELVKNPECMKKVQEEISGVVGGDRLLQETDVPNLPYLQAVVKEIFRLHPPGPLLVPRSATADCKVMGYDISKDTTLIVNVHAIGTDPTLWEDPHKFLPERFLGRHVNIDVKGKDFELIPFGAGRRICPGVNMGMSNVYLVLGNLVHVFEWKEPQGNEVDVKHEVFGITLHMAKKLQLIPSLRFPALERVWAM